MKAVVAAFNQEKALVGAFSVITNLRMDFFEALVVIVRVNSDVNVMRLLVWSFSIQLHSSVALISNVQV